MRRTLLALLSLALLCAAGCPCRCGGGGDSAGTTIAGTDRPT